MNNIERAGNLKNYLTSRKSHHKKKDTLKMVLGWSGKWVTFGIAYYKRNENAVIWVILSIAEKNDIANNEKG